MKKERGKIIQKLVSFKCLIEYIKKNANFVEMLLPPAPRPFLYNWEVGCLDERLISSVFPVLFPRPRLVGQIV